MPSSQDLHSLKSLIVKEFAEKYKSGMSVDSAKLFGETFREKLEIALPSIDVDECIKTLERQGCLKEYLDGSFELKGAFIKRFLPKHKGQ